MSINRFEKAPGDVLDYDFDFTRWLAPGDRITAASASLSGGTPAVDTTTFSDAVVRVWISGGADGDASVLSVVATTYQGRTKTATARIQVRNPA